MKTILTTMLAGAALVGVSLTSAEAMPIQHDLGVSEATILVSGGCGPYAHRGPYGGCRPGGGWRGPGWRGPGWRGPGWRGGPGWRHPGWRGPGWRHRHYY